MVVLGMNTRRESSKRAEEEMDKVGTNDNRVPLFEEIAMGDQVLVAPPPMTDKDIRGTFLKL